MPATCGPQEEVTSHRSRPGERIPASACPQVTRSERLTSGQRSTDSISASHRMRREALGWQRRPGGPGDRSPTGLHGTTDSHPPRGRSRYARFQSLWAKRVAARQPARPAVSGTDAITRPSKGDAAATRPSVTPPTGRQETGSQIAPARAPPRSVGGPSQEVLTMGGIRPRRSSRGSSAEGPRRLHPGGRPRKGFRTSRPREPPVRHHRPAGAPGGPSRAVRSGKGAPAVRPHDRRGNLPESAVQGARTPPPCRR